MIWQQHFLDILLFRSVVIPPLIPIQTQVFCDVGQLLPPVLT